MNDDFEGSSEDEHLRRLLNDVVSDIEPRGTLDSIRARISVSPNRQWILGVGAAVVATAATIAAVAVVGGNQGTTGVPDPNITQPSNAACTAPLSTEPPSASEEESSPSDSSSESASSPRAGMGTVPVYFLGQAGDGCRLFRETRFIDPAAHRGTAAVSLALHRPLDPDYQSGWPTGVKARSVKAGDGVITVDLAGAESLRERPAPMDPDVASLAVSSSSTPPRAPCRQAGFPSGSC